jgi:hypothetical protein
LIVDDGFPFHILLFLETANGGDGGVKLLVGEDTIDNIGEPGLVIIGMLGRGGQGEENVDGKSGTLLLGEVIDYRSDSCVDVLLQRALYGDDSDADGGIVGGSGKVSCRMCRVIKGLIIGTKILQRLVDSPNAVAGSIPFFWPKEIGAWISCGAETIDDEEKDVKNSKRDEQVPLLPAYKNHLGILSGDSHHSSFDSNSKKTRGESSERGDATDVSSTIL